MSSSDFSAMKAVEDFLIEMKFDYADCHIRFAIRNMKSLPYAG